ncbi:hypothetical protein O3P69_012693 [Scylla paramamosain]|uniref:Uncharacterized protein n=1 Tax=Scylla paramamosain TaxID=85552 RepID=A0AAW0SBK5_SCYPA
MGPHPEGNRQRDRAESAQLPEPTRRIQQDRHERRSNLVEEACQTASAHDAAFTYDELLVVQKTSRQTAPGEDQISSLVDYSAVALVGFDSRRIQALQTQQNKALRLIVGAPMWAKIANLQVETNVAPLEVRITKIVATVAAKILTRPGYTLTRDRLRAAIAQGPHFDDARWTRKVAAALTASNLGFAANLGEDVPNANYDPPPPWTATRTTYSCRLPDAPRDDATRRRIHGELQIARFVYEGSAVYYTDGSADPDTGRCGAAFGPGAAAGSRVLPADTFFNSPGIHREASECTSTACALDIIATGGSQEVFRLNDRAPTATYNKKNRSSTGFYSATGLQNYAR